MVSASPIGKGEQSLSCPSPRPVNVWSFPTILTISLFKIFPTPLLENQTADIQPIASHFTDRPLPEVLN